jgi:hypothetical protein
MGGKNMAFFEQVSQKLTQTSQEAVKKTKDMAEIVKLNSAITEEQKKMDSVYCQIGKTYYKNFADKEDEMFQDYIAEISRSEAALLEMKEALRRLKGLQACPSCGNEQPIGQVFCSACGAKLPEKPVEPVPSQEEDTVVCNACGAVLQKGAAFCTSCGAKVEQTD